MKNSKTTKQKSVLFIVDNYHVGGVTSFVKQYIEILLENGFSITILGFPSDIENPGKFFKGCTVLQINQKVQYNLSGRVKNLYAFLKTLHRIYLLTNIDIVHFGTTLSTLYALLHPTTWRKKRVITFYGAYDLERKSMSKQGKILCFFRRKLQELTLTQASKIITFSTYAKDLIGTHFNHALLKKVQIIPGYITDKKTQSSLKKRLPFFKIVNFGRAEPRKGLDLLLEASKLLISNGHKIKVFIASPFSYFLTHQELLNLYETLHLKDAVHFLHALNEEEKKELLSDADLFIIPSKELETFGLTIIEALSQNVPAIGTNTGAIPEILKPIHENLITKKSTAKHLAKQIEWYIQLSDKEKSHIKDEISKRVEHLYTKTICSKLLLQTYKEL